MARACAAQGLSLDPPDVETNLVWFEVDPTLATAGEVAAALKANGVLVHAAGPHTLPRLLPTLMYRRRRRNARPM